MHSRLQSTSCPVCLHQYRSTHTPKVLGLCGHTLCSKCLMTILQTSDQPTCPIDHSIISNKARNVDGFASNFSLLSLIEQVSAADNVCIDHQEPKTLACLTDNVLICYKCALHRHKDHALKSTRKLRLEVKEKKDQAQQSLQTVENNYKTANVMIERVKGSVTKTMHRKFRHLEYLVKSRELELLAEIDEFFTTKSRDIANMYGDESRMRKDLQDRISHYEKLEDKDIAQPSEDNLDVVEEFTVDEAATSVAIQQLEEKLDKFWKASLDHVNNELDCIIVPYDDLIDMGFQQSQVFPDQHLLSAELSIQAEHLTKLMTRFSINIDQDQLSVKLIQGNATRFIVRPKTLDTIKTATIEINKEEPSIDDILAIHQIFRHVKQLYSLKLVMGSTSVTDRMLMSYLHVLPLNKERLHSLELCLKDCCNVSDAFVVPFVERILPKMTNIQKLDLDLQNTAITNKSILQLSRYNTNMLSSLSRLLLHLRNTRVTDEGMALSFVPMPQMNSYFVSLTETKITDATMKAFSEKTLPSMKNLQEFSLNTNKTQITDQFIAFPSNLHALRMFSIGALNTQVKKDFYPRLRRDCLEKLTSIETLALYFNNIDNDDMRELCVPMKTLKSAIFNFNSNKHINDEVLEQFAETTLASAENLEKLDLFLSHSQATDAGALKVLAQLSKVKKIMLGLGYTKVTDKFGEEVCSQISSGCVSWTKFGLNVDGTDVSQNMLKMIKELSKSLQDLTATKQ